jgi:predicted  nucleic acid-binding Zn-ribbon protein
MTDESEFETTAERMDEIKETLSQMMSQIVEINAKVTCISSELTGFKMELEGVKGQLSEQDQTIKELTARVKFLEERQAPSGNQVEQLKVLIQREDEVRRRNNLVITGLDPFLPQGKKYENSKLTVEWLVNSRLATNVEVKEARRLGKARSDGSTVPLLIRLGSSADKWTIMNNCSKRRGTKIRVHEDLPIE